MNNDRFKFRVWDNVINVYWNEGKIQLSDDGKLLVVEGNMQPQGIEGVTVEQCTGLRDKNGKLIYEGDVVMCEIPGAFRSVEAVVKWFAPGDNRVEWYCKYLNHFEPNRTSKVISGYTGQELWGKKCTVIGNIHDEQFREVMKMVEDDQC